MIDNKKARYVFNVIAKHGDQSLARAIAAGKKWPSLTEQQQRNVVTLTMMLLEGFKVLDGETQGETETETPQKPETEIETETPQGVEVETVKEEPSPEIDPPQEDTETIDAEVIGGDYIDPNTITADIKKRKANFRAQT